MAAPKITSRPKLIASKLKFPISVLSTFPENVHQRCRFYTTPWIIHHSQVFIVNGVSRMALNSIFRFIKMSERDLKFVYIFCQTRTFPFELLIIPVRNVSILLALNLYIIWIRHSPQVSIDMYLYFTSLWLRVHSLLKFQKLKKNKKNVLFLFVF